MITKKCLICLKRPAVKVEPYGYLPCLVCQKQKIKKATNIEVTTEEIREGRRVFKKDITQPYRDGQLSKEYVEEYPNRIKEMIKEGNITQEEVKNAKPVWGETEYYKHE
jgi:hypothetical protein